MKRGTVSRGITRAAVGVGIESFLFGLVSRAERKMVR